MMSEEEEKKFPLVVLAEEKPVYIFSGDSASCPGIEKCLIKMAFDLPVGRCVVRILGGWAEQQGFEIIHDGMDAYEQKEEFVVRSCAECRYNPIARAVIDELVNPKPRESIEYEEHAARIKRIKARFDTATMADFMKQYIQPGFVAEIQKQSALFGGLDTAGFAGLGAAHMGTPPPGKFASVKIKLGPYSSRPPASVAARMIEADEKNHQAHIAANVAGLQRELNETMGAMFATNYEGALPVKPKDEENDDDDD
jgi:hypothetical protein